MKPSYEELELNLKETQAKLEETETKLEETETKLEETEAKLEEIHRVLKMALDRISDLEERLNKNSKNSSKPPSSDQKPNSPGNGKNRKRRNKGIHRQLIPAEDIDHFVKCNLESCPDCGSKELKELNASLMLQQVELPEAKAIITQFNCCKHHCEECGQTSFASLPAGVPNSAFGPRLMALLASLTGVFHLSKRDAMQLVKDLYGVDICEGSVINIEERVALSLNETYEHIHNHVMTSVFSKHFDETSWRNKGKGHYAWVASTSEASCLKIDPRRSKEAFQNFAKNLNQAPVVTDRYGVYEHLEQPHQYCLAHLIRDFRKYAEREGPDGEIGEAIEKELQQVCRNQREFREGKISKRSRDARFRHQKKRLDSHMLDGLANGSDELSKLCWRLLDKFSKLWTFSEFTDVDPTNNLAERDLRKVVLWRKKSYGTRSERGKRFVERISSVAQTLRRSGQNIIEYVQKSVSAFYHGIPAPMINSALRF